MVSQMIIRDKEPTIRILSLGAGVQSSTMALMADQGAFGVKPDAAVFADTGWEPSTVIDLTDVPEVIREGKGSLDIL